MMTGSKNKPTPTTGLRLNYVADIEKSLSQALEVGFSFICTNIVPESTVVQQLNGSMEIKDVFTWSEMALTAFEWQKGVVAVLSNLESEFNGTDQKRVQRAADILRHQLSYCFHLRLPAIVVELTQENFVSLANFLNSKFSQTERNTFGYWIKISMASQPESDFNSQAIKDPWKAWNAFRTLCKYEKLLNVVLELPEDIPEEDEVLRWLGESVKAIFIHTNTFTTNDSGYPVLTKAHQTLLKRFMRHKVQVVIDAENYSDGLKYHYAYIQHLWKSLPSHTELEANGFSDMDQLAEGFDGVLQIPLQPLQDNLESSTYEIFEKDPVKYKLYQQAIYQAILDRVPEDDRSTTRLVVMVVGAGRGPLVRASLRAAEMAGLVNIKVYAIEKNANAANTLFHFQRDDPLWQEKVTVVCTDIRKLSNAELADIIVSELLGSFGDNELSPECLDGAQVFLKDDGIMIPKNYTSFIRPIMCPSAYQDVAFTSDAAARTKEVAYEVPYVILMNHKYYIADPKKLFTFEHPNDPEFTHERYGSRTFISSMDCVMHGFAGYFESILYGDIMMSIHPATYTTGMFSWFPMYFPLKKPVPVAKDQEITAHFWRNTSKTKVWYEWTISKPYPVEIHNTNGKGTSMRLM